MAKILAVGLGMAAFLASTPAPAMAGVLGGDAAACTRGDTAFLVRVDGFKTRTGILRVQIYGDNPADFLAKGRKLRRIDLPVTEHGRMDVCIALPAAGSYAVAVRHDVDGNGKSGWSDGGGFSRNPGLSLLRLKPEFRDVVVRAGPGVSPIDVRLQYRRGLAIGPVAAG
jgi:uncharacterized protein (DUF2141 family)